MKLISISAIGAQERISYFPNKREQNQTLKYRRSTPFVPPPCADVEAIPDVE